MIYRWMRCSAIIFGLIACFAAQGAEAHAIILNSQPANNATLAVTTLPIKLRFNSRIDHARSLVTLATPDGNTTPLLISQQSAADNIISAARNLTPGSYTLHWQVLSVDGHLTRGDIPFYIVPVSTP